MRATGPVRFALSCLCNSPKRLWIILFACSALLAQPTRAADWPPIVPAELAMKDNPAEPGADAMILYREQLADATQSFETLYYRIKIFTKEGEKNADVEIPFVKGAEDIKDFHGRTIHPDGQVTEFEGKALEKVVIRAGSIKVIEKTMNLPDVTPGSIIEYRYKIQKDSDLIYNTYWHVQEGIYTKHAHFTYRPYVAANAPALYWRAMRLPPEMRPQKAKDGQFVLDLENLPGIPEEEYMMPVDELRGRVEFIYAWNELSKDPQEFWNNMGKKWFGEENSFVGKRGDIKQAADQAVSASDSPETKLRKLYARAQQIKNLDFQEERSVQEEKRDKQKDNGNVEDVLKHGYGTSQDVNRFFIALAQAEGFDAGSVWVTSRARGIFHMDLENPRELDDEFVWVHAGDKDYFLDPSVEFCPFDMIPWYETALSALRPTKQGATFMKVPDPPSTQSVVSRKVDLALDESGNFTGTFKLSFTGDRALGWREDGRNKDDAARRKMMLDDAKQYFPVDTKMELVSLNNWDKNDEPLEVVCKVSTNGLLQSAGRRVLMMADFLTAGRPQKFEHEGRKQSIYFGYPYEESDDIRIQMPMTLKIESVPSKQSLEPGGNLHYEYAASQDGAFLNVKRRVVVGGFLYPASAYGAIRQFFGQIKTNDEQQTIFQSASRTAANQ